MELEEVRNEISYFNHDNPPAHPLLEESKLLHHELNFLPREDEEDHYALIEIEVEVPIIQYVKYLPSDRNLDQFTKDINELELDDDPCKFMDVSQSTLNLEEDIVEGFFSEHVVSPP